MAEYSVPYGVISEGIIVDYGCKMSVSSGGTANRTTVTPHGSMYVSSGGTANSTTVNSRGSMTIFSGGTAMNISADADAVLSLTIAPKTYIQGTIAEKAFEVNDGIINDLVMEKLLVVLIASGGIANNMTVKNGNGSMCVQSGGTANNTTVAAKGSMYVSSGGMANNVSVNNGGTLGVLSGGTANSTTINPYGSVYARGTVVSTTINNSGVLWIQSNGSADSTTINSGGVMHVSSGGTANNTTISSGGNFWVYSGGTALNISAEEGAGLSFLVAPDTYFQGTSGGIAFEIKDGKTSDLVVTSNTKSLLVSSGGTANNTTVNASGTLYISSGGTANSTTVNSSGYLVVSSGGTANSTTLTRGYLIVFSGGTANNVSFNNNNGTLYVSSGGTALNVSAEASARFGFCLVSGTYVQGTCAGRAFEIKDGKLDGYVLHRGLIRVSSGGTANNISVNVGGSLWVSSGGTATVIFTPWKGEISSANGATVTYLDRDANVYYGESIEGISRKGDIFESLEVESGKTAVVYAGGIVKNTTVSNGGTLHVSSGGTALNLSVEEGAVFYLALAPNTYIQGTSAGTAFEIKNGIANNLAVKKGYIYVSSGGTANSTTVNSSGYLVVSSGGTANSTTVNSQGVMTVISGGTANSTTLSGGYLYVFSGGTANKVSVNSGGAFWVSSGGTANSTTVNSQGVMNVNRGGKVNSTTVNSGGTLYNNVGGLADIISVASMGTFCVGSGGTATNISADSGAYLIVHVASDTYVQGTSDGVAFEMKDAKLENFVISGGSFIVHSGGAANNTTVSIGGGLYVYSDGTANNTTVSIGGGLYVDSDGTANAIIENGGYVNMEEGAIVTFAKHAFSELTLSKGQSATIHSGTTATQNMINGGYFTVYSGGTANSTTVTSQGNMTVSSGGTADNIIIASLGYVNIYEDVTANSTTVDFQGLFTVRSGATANSTTVNYLGQMSVLSGGIANNIVIASQGYVDVREGATANNIAFNGGTLKVSNGGTATVFFNPWGGKIASEDGAVVTYFERDANVYYGGNKDGVIWKANSIESYEIERGRSAIVYSEGTANSVTVSDSGTLLISSGGTASNTTVKSGGCFVISSGAILRGNNSFAGSVTVDSDVDATGALINFDLTQVSAGGKTILTNLSYLAGAPVYMITVADLQAAGNYSLATGASNFNQTLTVMNTYGEIVGTLKSKEKLSVNGVDYTLFNTSGKLSLVVSRTPDTVAPVISNCTISQGTDSYVFTVSATAADDTTSVNSLRYQVKYAATANALANASALSGTSFTLAESDAGKTYYYQAGVIDAAGNTTWSDAASFTVRDVTAPVLNGVPVVSVNGRNSTFIWNAANDNMAVTGYTLTVDDTKYEVTGTSYTVNGLAVGRHNFTLSAYDAAGNRSAESEKVSFNVEAVSDMVAPVISRHSISQGVDDYAFTVSVTATDDKTPVNSLRYQVKYAATANALATASALSGTSFTLGESDAGKTYYYQAGVLDEVGNLAWSDAASFTIADVTAPELNGAPTVSVNGQKATFSWTPARDNVAVAGYTLTVDETKYEVTGTSYTVNGLAIGSHSFTLSAYDAAGNRSAQSASASFDVEEPEPADTTEPTILTYSISQKEGTYEFTVSVTATDDKTPADKLIYLVRHATGAGALLSIIPTEGKTFTVTPEDVPMTHYYQIGVRDEAGNEAWSVTTAFEIADVTAPALRGTPSVSVNGKSATFIWTAASDNVAVAGYTLTVDNTQYEVNGTRYTVNNLAVGSHSFTLSAYDAAGNRSAQSASASFDVEEPADTVEPTISTYSILQKEGTYEFTVSVTATDDKTPENSLRYQVKYAATIAALANASVLSGTSFTLSESDAGKTYYYQAGATDEAGNEAWSEAASFTVKDLTSDKIPPTISVSGNPTEWTNKKATLTATFTDDENGSGIATKQYKIDDTSWKNYTKAITIEKNSTVYFKATDKEGNTATETVYVTKIDMTSPKLGQKLEVAYNEIGEWLEFSWDEATDENLDGYRLIVNGQTYSPVSSPLETSYMLLSPPGKVTYHLEAYDKAGNVTKSKDKTYTISLPDLTPADLSITKNSKAATEFSSGDVITLSFTVKNIGNANAAGTSAAIYDGTQRCGTMTIDALGAGKSKKYTFTINASSLASGSHQLTVNLNPDAYDLIELDKTNNSATSASFTVSGSVSTTTAGSSTFQWTKNKKKTEYAYVQMPGVKESNFSITTTKNYHKYYMWTDSRIVDAEKDSETLTNYYLYKLTCWAATASNMFVRANWNNGISSLKTEDDVLRYFIDSFKVVGNGITGAQAQMGIEWLLDGYYDYWPAKWSCPISKYSGGFYANLISETGLEEYLAAQLISIADSYEDTRMNTGEIEWIGDYIVGTAFYYHTNQTYTSFSVLNHAFEHLKQGDAVGLSISFHKSKQLNDRDGGHAITVYGFTYDESKKGTPQYYTGIIVADSDDDKGSESNLNKKPAKDSPDRIKVLTLEYNAAKGLYILPDYGSYTVVDGFQFLAAKPDNVSYGLSSHMGFSINADWNASYSVGNSIQAALSGDRNERITTADNVFVALNLSNSDLGGSTVFTVTAVIDGQEENALSFQIERNVQYGESISDTVIDLGKLSQGSHKILLTVQDGERQDSIEIHSLYVAYDTNTLKNFTIDKGNDGYDMGLASGEMLTVAGGGTATGSIISENSEQVVKADAVALNTAIYAGLLTVENGGTARNTNVYEGGFLVANGSVSDTTVHAGGVLFADQDSDVSNTLIEADGWMDVNYQGSVCDTDIYGNLFVTNGTAERTIIRAGGFCEVYETGEMTNTTVENAGRQFVTSGGKATGNRFVGMESEQYVLDGGIAEGNTFYGSVQYVESAFVSDNEFRAGGVQELQDGAIAVGNRIDANSFQSVWKAYADDTTIRAGGTAFVFEGGLSVNCTVESGGFLVVGDPDGVNKKGVGAVRDLTVDPGGYAFFDEGAVLLGTNTIAGTITVSGAVTGASTGIEDITPSLVFDLSEHSVTDDFLISDITKCSGLSFSLTLAPDQGFGYYDLSARGATEFDGFLAVYDTDGVYYGTLSTDRFVVMGDRLVSLVPDGTSLDVSVTQSPYARLEMPAELVDTSGDHCSWGHIAGSDGYLVQLSKDGFQSCITVKVENESMKVNNMPCDMEWRIRPVGSEVWTNGGILSANAGGDGFVATDKDWNCDLLFVTATETWGEGYLAIHTGMADGWLGIRELVELDGKNKFANVFEATSDASILFLTDDANGDALFLEDLNTVLPESIEEQQARIARINEILAGAGDDVVDLTSQMFGYSGDGMIIRGGDGDDTIWANKDDNSLFGDAGDDRLAGASGNDLIAGGIGNDFMHGGGGDDVFTFCANWGSDVVRQLASGSVTLWFASGSLSNWDASTLTYTDGTNSVMLFDVAEDQVTLKFGDDGSDEYSRLSAMGAFAGVSSEKIFEENGTGYLA